jgi:hypothetical protein
MCGHSAVWAHDGGAASSPLSGDRTIRADGCTALTGFTVCDRGAIWSFDNGAASTSFAGCRAVGSNGGAAFACCTVGYRRAVRAGPLMNVAATLASSAGRGKSARTTFETTSVLEAAGLVHSHIGGQAKEGVESPRAGRCSGSEIAKVAAVETAGPATADAPEFARRKTARAESEVVEIAPSAPAAKFAAAAVESSTSKSTSIELSATFETTPVEPSPTAESASVEATPASAEAATTKAASSAVEAAATESTTAESAAAVETAESAAVGRVGASEHCDCNCDCD